MKQHLTSPLLVRFRDNELILLSSIPLRLLQKTPWQPRSQLKHHFKIMVNCIDSSSFPCNHQENCKKKNILFTIFQHSVPPSNQPSLWDAAVTRFSLHNTDGPELWQQLSPLRVPVSPHSYFRDSGRTFLCWSGLCCFFFGTLHLCCSFNIWNYSKLFCYTYASIKSYFGWRL